MRRLVFLNFLWEIFFLVEGFCNGCRIVLINGEERLFFEYYDDFVSLGVGIW